MKAHPSIAFDSFSGSAGEVTARHSKNGTILSSRAQHDKVSTPAQKAERAILARIVRSYKKLSDEHHRAWSFFARYYESGSDCKLSGFNAYVRHNCNRALLGLAPIAYPPTDYLYVPQVNYTYMTVTPELILLEGIEEVGPSFRLAVAMSKATSAGVSRGAGRCVLIAPDFTPNEGSANLTRIYTNRLGLTPVAGQKYFVTVYWIERNTGFTGPRTTQGCICRAAANP